MVKIYQSGRAFLDENLTLLLKNKYASSLIVLNSKVIDETNKSNYLLKVENDEKVLLANGLQPYNVLLYGDYECVPEMLAFLLSNDYVVPGFMCSTEIGDHLEGYQKTIGLDFMEAYQKSEFGQENIVNSTLDDVDEIVELTKLFCSECGLNDQTSRQKIESRIDSYRVIKKDNKIISMARIAYDTENSSRISMVYTRKEYRGEGKAKEVVSACKNEILSSGKIATLNVDQNNPISYHLYKSLGFKKVFSQGIYIKQ